MGDLVNNLAGQDAHTLVLARAAGEHLVRGHLLWSYSTGTAPDHTVYARYVLGEGIWDAVEGAWYDGVNIPESDYIFHNGTQTETGAFFPMDTAHTGFVLMDLKIPGSLADADTAANPPDKFAGRFRCECFPKFDNSGNQIDEVGNVVAAPGEPLDKSHFTYTVNPFRVLAGWYLQLCLDARREDIDYPLGNEWGDYCSTLDAIDYTTLEKGFGLTGRYYLGENFDTLVSTRVDAVVQFDNSEGAPAVGIGTSEFSARYQGKITVPTPGDYEFQVTHDNGARLWVGDLTTPLIDQWATLGTHSATKTGLVTGTYYDIKLDWYDGAGPLPNPAEIKLEWKKPGAGAFEVVPPENLYPLSASQERYRCDVAFSQPNTMDAVIDRILTVTNSVRQDVDGKMQFRCIEQLVPTFEITADNDTILKEMDENGQRTGRDLIAWSRSDRRVAELANVWVGNMLALETQYLEKPLEPPQIEFPELIAAAGGRRIYADVELGSMNTVQAYKVLRYIANRSVVYDGQITMDATARTYPIIANDVGVINHPAISDEPVKVLAVECVDRSAESTADLRIFRFQEWWL